MVLFPVVAKMKLALCGCRTCRRGRRAYHSITRSKVKAARATVHRLLHVGEYERLPERVVVGYTD